MSDWSLEIEFLAKKLGMEVIGRAPHGGYEHLVFAVKNPALQAQGSGLKA